MEHIAQLIETQHAEMRRVLSAAAARAHFLAGEIGGTRPEAAMKLYGVSAGLLVAVAAIREIANSGDADNAEIVLSNRIEGYAGNEVSA